MQVPDDLERRLIGMVEELVKAKGAEPAGIGPETTFESLQFDSLDKINLSFDVEEAFGIAIPDTAINTIRSVNDMAEGVRTLLAARVA